MYSPVGFLSVNDVNVSFGFCITKGGATLKVYPEEEYIGVPKPFTSQFPGTESVVQGASRIFSGVGAHLNFHVPLRLISLSPVFSAKGMKNALAGNLFFCITVSFSQSFRCPEAVIAMERVRNINSFFIVERFGVLRWALLIPTRTVFVWEYYCTSTYSNSTPFMDFFVPGSRSWR